MAEGEKINRKNALIKIIGGLNSLLAFEHAYATKPDVKPAKFYRHDDKTRGDIKNYFPSEIYQRRFSEYGELFERYSKNPPYNMTKQEFEAILAAISEKESSMGYPNGDCKFDRAFMGYGSGKIRNRNAEDQLSAAASVLREALNGNHPSYPNARNCNGQERILYVLKTYNQGDNLTKEEESIAEKYAESVYAGFLRWKNFFEIGVLV